MRGEVIRWPGFIMGWSLQWIFKLKKGAWDLEHENKYITNTEEIRNYPNKESWWDQMQTHTEEKSSEEETRTLQSQAADTHRR